MILHCTIELNERINESNELKNKFNDLFSKSNNLLVLFITFTLY